MCCLKIQANSRKKNLIIFKLIQRVNKIINKWKPECRKFNNRKNQKSNKNNSK